LLQTKVVFDADSVAQAMSWKDTGGKECGLRICVADTSSPYGVKFGIPVSEISLSIQFLEKKGLTVHGLHIHESHADNSPEDMVDSIAALFHKVERPLLAKMRYLNIGGGWPIQDGYPVSEYNMESVINDLRIKLKQQGFTGKLTGEPGEWVVGPAGYWVARVSAIKAHPLTSDKKICIMDSATPIPCRPSKAGFVLLNSSGEQKPTTDRELWDIYGSANNGLDTIGINIMLGDVQPGDIIVSCCQGAYVRSLTSSFNERSLPAVLVI
jgi:diaminopimelate decarboxylase